MPTIIPKDPADAERLRKALLAAAGDRPERVKYSTAGPTLSFDVDDELASAISGDAPADADPDRDAEDIDEDTGDETPVLDPPDRNASTDEWAIFMAAVPGADPVKGKTRKQLIANWDQLTTTTE